MSIRPAWGCPSVVPTKSLWGFIFWSFKWTTDTVKISRAALLIKAPVRQYRLPIILPKICVSRHQKETACIPIPSHKQCLLLKFELKVTPLESHPVDSLAGVTLHHSATNTQTLLLTDCYTHTQLHSPFAPVLHLQPYSAPTYTPPGEPGPSSASRTPSPPPPPQRVVAFLGPVSALPLTPYSTPSFSLPSLSLFFLFSLLFFFFSVCSSRVLCSLA